MTRAGGAVGVDLNFKLHRLCKWGEGAVSDILTFDLAFFYEGEIKRRVRLNRRVLAGSRNDAAVNPSGNFMLMDADI